MSVSSSDTPVGAMAAGVAVEATPVVEPDPPVDPPAPVVPAAKKLPFMSEGVRVELEMLGKAGCPATGGTFVKDKATGKVTFTERSGKK